MIKSAIRYFHLKDNRTKCFEYETVKSNIQRKGMLETPLSTLQKDSERQAKAKPGNTKGGKYDCTVKLLFDWFGISCMTTDIFCIYLQNRLIQTSQTGGQQYSDTSSFSIPWPNIPS